MTDPGAQSAAIDIDAAKAGLAAYLEANRPETPQTSTNIPGCPALGSETAEAALAEVGHPDVTLGGWTTEIEWDEYEALDPELMGIACGGDSDGDPNDSAVGLGLGVAAVDLTGRADLPSFLGTVGLEEAEPFDAAADAVPGERLLSCYPGEGCLALWSDEGLVIVVGLLGADPTQDQATRLLDAQLPTILQSLSEA